MKEILFWAITIPFWLIMVSIIFELVFDIQTRDYHSSKFCSCDCHKPKVRCEHNDMMGRCTNCHKSWKQIEKKRMK